jgi:LL-diaminopimelate aminotransferase
MTSSWISPADRLLALPPYIFSHLDRLKLENQDEDIIDLGMGNPSEPTPIPILEEAITAIQNPRNHGYPPSQGTPDFRKAISTWYYRRYGVSLNSDDEILPLLGSKEGLAHLAMAYVNPGDLVLTPTPSYPVHFRGPLLAGGEIYPLVLKAENNWLIDLAAIPEHIAKRAKILYFNYPNNPTTSTAPLDFFVEMVAFARRHEILLVHDLCYAELSFDNYCPISLLEIPGAIDVGVEFHTLSKTYSMAGWRVGFTVGNRHIIQGLRDFKANVDYGVFPAIQAAAAAALRLPDIYLQDICAVYRSRRDFFVAGLRELGWNIPTPAATMYLWIPCPINVSSADFSMDIFNRTHVLVTPGSAFGEGGEGYVRISLIEDRSRLQEVLNRFHKVGIRYGIPTPSLARI